MVKTVHIAGMGTRVRTHVRQLCAWCGYRLIDDDLALMASSDPGGPQPGAYGLNALVEITETPGFRGSRVVDPPADGGLPEGNCVRIELGPGPSAPQKGPSLATVTGDGCGDSRCDPKHAHGRFLPGDTPGVCLEPGCACMALVRITFA